jgi:hypothetical protein
MNGISSGPNVGCSPLHGTSATISVAHFASMCTDSPGRQVACRTRNHGRGTDGLTAGASGAASVSNRVVHCIDQQYAGFADHRSMRIAGADCQRRIHGIDRWLR